MLKISLRCLLCVGLTLALGAAAPIRTQRVAFAKGTSAATVKGHLQGYAIVDYVVRAFAGQTLSVTLDSDQGANYFNILPPGSADVAMFIGSLSGEQTNRLLPSDGDYKIRVYLMRGAARENQAADYTLRIGVTGKPLAPLPASVDALIPGTPYHASARIPCHHSADESLHDCESYVIRRDQNGATVEVRWPAGRRRILFVKGQAVATDSTEVLTASRSGDRSLIQLGGTERYEIPDPLVSGG